MRGERRRMMATIKGRMLKYLENPSTAYIDTGVVPSDDTVLQIQTNISHLGFVVGSRIGYDNGEIGVCIEEAGNFRLGFGSAYRHFYDLIYGSDYKFVLAKDRLTVNDQTINISGGSNSDFPIFLFAINHSGEPFVNASTGLKVYSCKIWEKAALVRDFVPMRFNHQFGMYDLVGKKFYTSPNGIKFTGGGKP